VNGESLPPGSRPLVRKISASSGSRRADSLASRQRKTLIVCPSNNPPAWLTEQLIDIAERFACVRKQGRVLARWCPPGEAHAVYLKCQSRFRWMRRLLAAVHPKGFWTPALTELRNLVIAQRAGIDVPEPIGAIQRVGPRTRLAGVLAIRELAGHEPLHEALFRASERLPRKDYEPVLRNVLTAIAAVAARLHGAHLFHRDFYLCHFFVQPQMLFPQRDEPPALVLIDFHRLVRSRALRIRSAAKDLGQLLYSLREIRAPAWATDYVLERYLQHAGVSRMPGRLLCALAKAKADRYWQHNLHRGTIWHPEHASAA